MTPTAPLQPSVPSIDFGPSQGQVAGVASAVLESEEERKKRLKRMTGMKKGGKIDGCAIRGKTRAR